MSKHPSSANLHEYERVKLTSHEREAASHEREAASQEREVTSHEREVRVLAVRDGGPGMAERDCKINVASQSTNANICKRVKPLHTSHTDTHWDRTARQSEQN